MTPPFSLRYFRISAAQRSLALVLIIAIWFGSVLLITGHGFRHYIEPDNHCALCIAQANLSHALPAALPTVVGSPSAPLLNSLLSPILASAHIIAPGNRDPPISA